MQCLIHNLGLNTYIREGLDLCELENAPERQRKAPECPKAFVHDFSLGSTADYAYMLDFNVVTAVKRGYPPTSIT